MLPWRKEGHKRQREAFPKSTLWIKLKNKSRTWCSRICPVQNTSPCFHRRNHPKPFTHLQGSLPQQDVQGAPFRERNLPWFSPIMSNNKNKIKPQRPSCPQTRGMAPRGVISITLSATTQHTNSLFSKSDHLPGEQIHSPGISGLYHIIPLIKQSSPRLKTVRFLPCWKVFFPEYQ